MYIVFKEQRKKYICIFEDEPTIEQYFKHFFELLFISGHVPDDLVADVGKVYAINGDFLNILPEIVYQKIRELEQSVTIVVG